MHDDAMFAPLDPEETARDPGHLSGAQRKIKPITPVPEDAPPCRWRHPKHGMPVAMWDYRAGDGRLIAHAARVEYMQDGEREKKVLPVCYCCVDDGKGRQHAWRACGLPSPRPLYCLPELVAAPLSPVIVTEGEKKADVVPALFPGHLGTTSMGGACAASSSDWSPLAGRDVVIWPDHDLAGLKYADDVAALEHFHNESP